MSITRAMLTAWLANTVYRTKNKAHVKDNVRRGEINVGESL